MNHQMLTGDEPPVDGMHIAVRLRRDFIVTDARRLLAAGRAAYLELNPGAAPHEAAQMVTSVADAVFTLLEQDGIFGHAVDTALTAHVAHGLQPAGWRAQVTVGEPQPLPPGPDCIDRGDVFALPAPVGSPTSKHRTA